METRLTYTIHGTTINVGDFVPFQGGVIITKIVRYPNHKHWRVEYMLLQENYSWSKKAHEFVKFNIGSPAA